MSQRRKVAFSGKKKKDQLFQKRQRKSTQKPFKKTFDSQDDEENTEDNEFTARKLMEQPWTSGKNKNVNRYNLYFYQESKKELERLKLECFEQLASATPDKREIDTRFFEGCDFPQRPEWSFNMSKEKLDANENRYFREYVEKFQQQNGNKELSLFELNLETWRQLWRVLEISDILLIIVDVRYATLMFPPSLYQNIIGTLKKHAILVLNKVDLVTPEAVVAWRNYFQKTYPGLPVVLFASYNTKVSKCSRRGRLMHKRSMESVYNIYKECKKIVQSEVNVSSWEQKIHEDMKTENILSESEEATGNFATEDVIEKSHSQDEPHTMLRDGILTVGCIGFPNVGKSSLINALKGRKVVSVSRTPGHTKHFQTIFLTNTVRLCDSPGLVFPSWTPKHLQVLIGSYPIAQLKVPYRSLKFLAEHLNLPKLLKISLPEDFDEWSAGAIADAWALKRGFLIAKTAHPDRNRAANHLLRMCLAGQQDLVLQFYPPEFHKQKDQWLIHPETEEVKKYQNTKVEEKDGDDDTSSFNSESVDSDDINSSNDETTDDEEESDEESLPSPNPTNCNPFALLDD